MNKVFFTVLSATVPRGEEESDYWIQLQRVGNDVSLIDSGKMLYGSVVIDYKWKTGATFCFLSRAEPQQTGTTFTTWFRDMSKANFGWRLIAEFFRPKEKKYLEKISSSNHNIQPEFGNLSRSDYGNLTRMAIYSNQWYYSFNVWK